MRLLLPLAPAPAAVAADAAGALPATDLPNDGPLPAFVAGAHLGSDPPPLDPTMAPVASAQSPAKLHSPGSTGNFAASAGAGPHDNIIPSAAAAAAPQHAGESTGNMAGAMEALTIST